VLNMANKEESTTIDSYQELSFFIESEGERTMDSAADGLPPPLDPSTN